MQLERVSPSEHLKSIVLCRPIESPRGAIIVIPTSKVKKIQSIKEKELKHLAYKVASIYPNGIGITIKAVPIIQDHKQEGRLIGVKPGYRSLFLHLSRKLISELRLGEEYNLQYFQYRYPSVNLKNYVFETTITKSTLEILIRRKPSELGMVL